MANQTDKGRAEAFPTNYYDEGDSTFSKQVASHLRVWNATTLVWNKVTVNNVDGGLNVHISGGVSVPTAGTVADGADVTLGAIADAAVTGDLSGSVNAHLRGITKQLAGTVAVSIASMPSTPVTGTFWQSTQPVSNTGTFAVQASLAAETTKVIGTVNISSGQTVGLATGSNVIGSISNTSFAATQATASALNATVVGTGTFVVQATLAAETTKVIGTVNQGTSPWVVNNSQISGTAISVGNGITDAGTQRVAISTDNVGTVKVTNATASQLNALVAQGAAGTAAAAWFMTSTNTGFNVTGTDGLTTQTATVKTYNGANMLFTRDPATLSLLSDVLAELYELNTNIKELH